MGVIDGQRVSQGVTNPAFINKNIDDEMPNKLGFTRPTSGADIADIQQAVNNIYAATGVSESADGTTYDAPAGTIVNGDPYETALALLADKFDSSTGHMHTGAAGDAPPISSGDISGVPLLGYIQQGTTISGVTGPSSDVSALLVGKIPSTNSTTAGISTTSPNNKVRLLDADTGYELIDSLGNTVFGRITYSPTTWTLSYLSEVAGVETSYSFGSSVNLAWFYEELFNPMDVPPVYALENRLFGSNPVQAIPIATGSLYGKVRAATGTPAPVASAGAAGTVNGVYPNADHVHAGVHSLAKSGSSQILGDVTLSEGTNISLSQVGNNIEVSSSAGGGGGSLLWIEEANAPTPVIESGVEVYVFDAGLGQELTAVIQVPPSYTPGSPIKLLSLAYSADTVGNLLFQTVSRLIRTGVDAISSTANQRTSTNAAIALSGGTSMIPQSIEFDISDSSGEINGVAISPLDTIIIQLLRGTDTSTVAAREMVLSSVLTFT